jgi:hypothetical protein
MGLLTALAFNPVYAMTSRLTARLPRYSVPRHLYVELVLVVAYCALLVVGVCCRDRSRSAIRGGRPASSVGLCSPVHESC